MEGGTDLLLLGPLDPMLVEACCWCWTAEVVPPRRLNNMVQVVPLFRSSETERFSCDVKSKRHLLHLAHGTGPGSLREAKREESKQAAADCSLRPS